LRGHSFGQLFHAIRVHRALDATLDDGTIIPATRKQIRDHIRATRLRNDGKPKEMP